ncbi:MAG: HD-GYP domain-containing protein [Solobacterium sp.]|nr:HD-GYP domain-containing protein [Solobacterium sp.]
MMEKTTTARIKQLGRALAVVCRITRLMFSVAGIAALAGSIVSLIKPDFIEYFEGMYKQNFIYQILSAFAGIGTMEDRYAAAIGCFITALSFFALSYYMRRMQNFFVSLIESEKPFTTPMAKRLRRSSFAFLMIAVYNPLLAIVLCLFMYFLSYLAEYGAYLQEQADQTNRIQGELIYSFAEITENKSRQTGQHIRRVSEYSKILAQAMGMSPEQAENLKLASTMHDIGKLLVPGEILEKPGKLTNEEFAEIKKHPSFGGQLLDHVEGDVMELAKTVALEHHERPDGKGYPTGKTDGSLEGRIVAVADVYDALTSRRSYKEAWAEDRAYQEIVKGSGTQFDPEVVEAFKKNYDKISEVREKYKD